MPQITTGLANAGKTAHFQFSYDASFAGSFAPGGPEPARTNAVIAACEADHAWLTGLFGGGVHVTGIDVHVATQAADPCGHGPGVAGACWRGTQGWLDSSRQGPRMRFSIESRSKWIARDRHGGRGVIYVPSADDARRREVGPTEVAPVEGDHG